MGAKEDLEAAGWILYRAEIRRQQAEEAGKRARENGMHRKTAAEWKRIQREFLKMAERYEAPVRKLLDGISCLPEPYQTAARRHWLENVPVRDIADEMFYSYQTIYRTLRTALRLLEERPG